MRIKLFGNKYIEIKITVKRKWKRKTFSEKYNKLTNVSFPKGYVWRKNNRAKGIIK